MTEWGKIAQFGGEQVEDYAFPGIGSFEAGTAPAKMPLPPQELRLYSEDDANHLSGGRYDYDKIVNGLMANGIELSSFNSILEFGCSNGRVLRWFIPESYRGAEVWGVDIDARRALWSQIAYTPHAHIAVSTTIPHLPFVEGKFDFLYATSILTHIDPTWLSWFLELARIIQPGGYAWITVHDEVAANYMAESSGYFPSLIREQTRFLEFREAGAHWYATGSGVLRNTFFNRAWLIQQLSPVFDFVDAIEQATGGYQTALLLRRK